MAQQHSLTRLSVVPSDLRQAPPFRHNTATPGGQSRRITKTMNPEGKQMKTSIAAATAALLLAGCSSSVLQSKEDPIITELTGKSADYVQSKLGLPNRRADTRSGAMVWTYFDKQKGMT